MGTEQEDATGDPRDDAERDDYPARRCAHLRTYTNADGQVVCRDCWQVVDWIRG